MICAYCGKEAKGTKEHIISSGILGLFPECFATIDGERSIVHQGDPMVKDVCADCNNNRISYIDSYAKEFIENGVVGGGMLPKLNNCIDAIEQGVSTVHILDGRVAHCLLLEFFTEKGIGTATKDRQIAKTRYKWNRKPQNWC